MRKLIPLIAVLALPTMSSAAVTSFNTRTGVVTSQTGDYTCAQVTNCGPTNATNTWTGFNTFGPQTNISVPYDGTTGGPTNIPVFYHTGAFSSGLVSPRTAAVLQLLGIPQYAAGTDEEVNIVNAFAYGGSGAVNLERYDRGTVPVTAAISTSSPTLQFANTPAWVTPGAVVTLVSNGASVGTVQSVSSTTITLTANAANGAASGAVVNIVGVNNGAVQSGEPIGDFGFDPYDGISDANTSSIGAYATETQSNSGGKHGTGVTITYTPNGSGSNKRYTGITISHSGNGGVTIGDNAYQSPPVDEGSGTLNIASALYADNGMVVADSVGHLRGMAGSFTPGVTNSGTVVSGSTDNRGEIAAGGTASTLWIINWGRNWPTRPFCTITPLSTAGGAVTVSASTSSMGVTFQNAYNGGFDWVCL